MQNSDTLLVRLHGLARRLKTLRAEPSGGALGGRDGLVDKCQGREKLELIALDEYVDKGGRVDRLEVGGGLVLRGEDLRLEIATLDGQIPCAATELSWRGT